MRRKLRRVLFLIMTVIITFVGCGESNKTKTVDKKASIATEEKKSDDLINNQKKEETVEMEQESFEKETIKKEDAKKEDSKKNDAKKDTSKQENTVQNDSKKNDSKSDSKKKETSNKTNPSTSNKKQETTKPSASASTPAKPATNSGRSNKENSNKTESVHQHNYVAQTHVVHHEATGHNEQYVEQEAWDEQVTIYEDYAWDCCNVCRADITNNVNEHEKAHALAYEGGGHHIEYGTRPVTTTVHHEAVYGTRWVQDNAAYDETVVDGYVCSCGARK